MLIRLLIASLLATAIPYAAPIPAPPNFLLIMADDLGYSDLGCFGSEIATPNLDALAAEGLRFTKMYSTGRCWPSRTALISGLYPQQVGGDSPSTGKIPRKQPAWQKWAPQHLAQAGYRSYQAGKWHLQSVKGDKREATGFAHTFTIKDQNRFFNPRNNTRDGRQLPQPKPGDGYYSAIATTDHAITWLTEHAADHGDKPFFSYVAYIGPHFPLHALPQDIAKYKGRYRSGWNKIGAERLAKQKKLGIYGGPAAPLEPEIYPSWNDRVNLTADIDPAETGRAVPWDTLTPAQQEWQAAKMELHAAMIDRIDQEIGRLLAQLKKMGAYENTIVVFISDNGASGEILNRGDKHQKGATPGSAESYLCLGPGWSSAGNTPFRLHKTWNHEGGISSPAVLHWPAGLKGRNRIHHDTPLHFIDILPTFLELAGVEPLHPLEGRSFAALLKEDAAPAHFKGRDLYFAHQGARALRRGDYKIVSLKNKEWELYKISEDRIEQNNLAKSHPEKLQELTRAHARVERRFLENYEKGL